MIHHQRESAIVRCIMKKLAPHCLVRKRHGSVHSVKGDPDLYGVLPANHPFWPCRHFEIEVKRPGESPTLLQLARLQAWKDAGAITGVVMNVLEVMDVLRLGPEWAKPSGNVKTEE